jgi:RNA polymerase sigma-70 factor (ECF subfamily)
MSERPPARAPAPVVSLDRPLLERARRGDTAAFHELFRQNAPRVWRFSKSVLGSASAADEVTQESFVRAHAALVNGVPVERALPWLLGVARNVAREHLRLTAKTVALDEPVDDRAASLAPDPEALLLEREADALLARALTRLDDDRRAALVLRVEQQLSYDEIAEVLGWNLARVKNEIHRARLQLRAALSAHR